MDRQPSWKEELSIEHFLITGNVQELLYILFNFQRTFAFRGTLFRPQQRGGN